MKILGVLFFLSTTCFWARAQEQKIVGDCTAVFSISSSEAATNTNLAGSTKTLFIKGKLTRVDMSGAAFMQSTFYDDATGSAVILKDLNGAKYMTKIDAQKWKEQNSRYEGIKITYTGETKTILGYECKRGSALLKDGGSFSFFYATAIIPSSSENPYQFKDIPGFVLEYEIIGADKNSKITYSATRINFNPVPASKFEIPTSGYRVLNN